MRLAALPWRPQWRAAAAPRQSCCCCSAPSSVSCTFLIYQSRGTYITLNLDCAADALSGRDGQTPLHAAVAHGDLKTAQLWIELGADVNRPVALPSQRRPL